MGRIGAIIGGTVGGLVGLAILGTIACHVFIRDLPLLTRMGIASWSRTTRPGRRSSHNAQHGRRTFPPTELSHQSLPYSFFTSVKSDGGREHHSGPNMAAIRPVSQAYTDHMDLPYSPITEHSSAPPTPSTATPLMVYPPSPSRPLNSALEYTPYVRNNPLYNPPEPKYYLGQERSIIGCEPTENTSNCHLHSSPYSNDSTLPSSHIGHPISIFSCLYTFTTLVGATPGTQRCCLSVRMFIVTIHVSLAAIRATRHT